MVQETMEYNSTYMALEWTKKTARSIRGMGRRRQKRANAHAQTASGPRVVCP